MPARGRAPLVRRFVRVPPFFYIAVSDGCGCGIRIPIPLRARPYSLGRFAAAIASAYVPVAVGWSLRCFAVQRLRSVPVAFGFAGYVSFPLALPASVRAGDSLAPAGRIDKRESAKSGPKSTEIMPGTGLYGLPLAFFGLPGWLPGKEKPGGQGMPRRAFVTAHRCNQRAPLASAMLTKNRWQREPVRFTFFSPGYRPCCKKQKRKRGRGALKFATVKNGTAIR